MTEQDKDIVSNDEQDNILPILPLRDVVIYPKMVMPLFIGREKSITALEEAVKVDRKLMVLSQCNSEEIEPSIGGLYKFGTIVDVLHLLKLPDGTLKVLLEGKSRAKVKKFLQQDPYYIASYDDVPEPDSPPEQCGVLIYTILSQFESYVEQSEKISDEILLSLKSIEDPVRLVDTIASHINIKIEQKQKILEFTDLYDRIEYLMGVIETEIDLLKVESRIRGSIRKQMEKTHREYYLNEQLKAIQKELGKSDSSGFHDEFNVLDEKINQSGMPKDAFDKAKSELSKLKLMQPMSAEATVCRNYIDTLVGVPWEKKSRIRHNLNKAEQVLNSEHYGLDRVKERIVEYLAVQKRVDKLRGPILCLVGPPGVGKTSLARSIANSTNREYIRIALGGVRDESEIRGHRRTYVGAMPGKIIQQLSKVGVKNPLILLDEIDKMSMDFRGDPASALLEVLDPEQNSSFSDHYLEVEYDLSDVMFVATSNSLNIPPALLDRMEVIKLEGYTEDEKLSIAQEHLLNKQFKLNGLRNTDLKINNAAILKIIRNYTREAGVRSLEREISKISRKTVRKLLNKDAKQDCYEITEDNISDYLGVIKYRFGEAEEQNRIGRVTGLAWTEVGGEILTLEAAIIPGSNKIIQTGKLGDVMKESIQAAMTVSRRIAQELKIKQDIFENNDFHIHVPEGATPKDGPSAGIGMCTVIVSVVANLPVKKDIAMTGEISLHGQVLPIGGLKEKLLAARRAGIKEVIIPEDNAKDLSEIPENVYDQMTIHTVSQINEVLQLALSTKKTHAIKKLVGFL